ncbi:hydroxymethylbilane synthase [Aggregatimonas sangjinii]|uniref:Hydroxymethylbilane synthase n=1 Tax=Aggregatimonas sangjinii TaxID=2583587 RepID=A0A5B7SW35_9FLAO|nr:hydroxymethylbilane synthase [Aggregatimonas sangjinii]QCX01519.1 hydroxymethylbilane synthase [Aggregatimonas sangjinii]
MKEKVIRIGTRDSELALWQANTVKDQLEALGNKTVLVPIKSTGDLVLDKPLYELGITGIFTKTLDVAMIKGEIDIAVHSLKDVPTKLPEGIVQAAVLERGNFYDILAYKDNQEFLAEREATIATGSLRRKAQWLNRYPTHTVVGLRGNVNSRHEKLEQSNWNGAIFAAAGLERIGLEPENTIGLTWMLPAPAQGAVMIAAMEHDEFVRAACEELNHRPTEICTSLEREFLRILEGGCSAPIGALALIKEEEITLKGVLLSVDGTKKLEIEKTAEIGKHEGLAQSCADHILNRGGKRLMNDLVEIEQRPTVFSTKKLTSEQQQQFDKRMKVDSDDFVKIYLNRIPAAALRNEIQNVVITSKNAVEALLASVDPSTLKFTNIYCVGRRTKKLIEARIGKVTHVDRNAKALAEHLVDYMEGLEVTYFCSSIRLDELPDILTENNITVHEVEAYETKLSPVKVPDGVKRMLFFSPSTVESFLLKNTPGKRVAYCIGETTAKVARKHFEKVLVAELPSVTDVIKLVNTKTG